MQKLTDTLLDNLEKMGTAAVSGVTAAAAAFLASRLRGSENLVVITPDEDSARDFSRDLSLFLGAGEALYFPPFESLPYDNLTPDIDTTAFRISALAAAKRGVGPVVLPAKALLQPTPPPAVLSQWELTVRKGQDLYRDDLMGKLSVMGYQREPVVSQVGDIAVRGGILDLFSPLSDKPVRIELWGDEVSTLRHFDPQTQRSGADIEEFVILPVTELLLDPGERKNAEIRLGDSLANAGVAARERDRVLSLFRDGLELPGTGLLLPLLYSESSYPLDHISENSLLLLHEPEEIRANLQDYYDKTSERKVGAPLAPGRVYLDPATMLEGIHEHRTLLTGLFHRPGASLVECRPPLPSTLPSSRPDRIVEFTRLLQERRKQPVILCVRTSAAADRLQSIISESGLGVRRVETFPEALKSKDLTMLTRSLSGGFSLPDENLTVISDADLFGPPSERKASPAVFPEWDLPIGSLMRGDIAVHIDHGIGRYEGLRQLDVAGSTDDFLHLTFADGDSLYVPVWQMNRIQRYRSGSETTPTLSKLGSAAWNRSKTRIRKSLKLMADELLKLSAARQGQAGHTFAEPDSLFREFEVSFPWTETPDQERTISEVIGDMTSSTPMDRLVCGDVGFGKTEVAMRAAFLAAVEGRQTAILVPTTVLAQQHYQNFTQRLKDFPVTVGLMSRFVTPQKQKATLNLLANGNLDIVIGTHRILSSDVVFHDLGLVVIDEEHRFGVRHKERLKKLRETIDVLTLSATPIPRTLFQAFSGLRSLSLIHTPPPDRKSVHTEVRYFEEDIIRDAINREMERGGQVYLVHNRVQTIDAVRQMVEKLVPHAKVGMAHGQMGEGALEEVMIRFLQHDYDVLVTTAIIESGLDIANANTLIVNRADRFGLAQLYQLRGRVGRSSRLAYAYLLIPPEGSISDKARKRLRSLRELSELGSGFKLASYDLEMRGAGNLLGEEQSGRIDAVGLELYSQLLEQAVREASDHVTQAQIQPSVTLPLPAYLPEEYLPEVGERLTLYKRLASAPDQDSLDALREETRDRFGRFPVEVTGLFTRMEVEIAARDMSIERIDTAGPYLLAAFHPGAKVSPDALVRMLTSDKRLAFLPPSTLRMDVSGFSGVDDRISYMMDVLRSL
ncbi:MAG: transcription-repair coupling factor [bacterium]|nr:transcription-repair coupling factor [bacterium]MDT8365789.1 transcription-repair coupling factor [bacterium]